MVSFGDLRAGECFLGGWLDALITSWACFAAMMISAFHANSGKLSSPSAASCTRTSSSNCRRKIRRKRLFRSTARPWMYAHNCEGVQSPRPIRSRSLSAFWSSVRPYTPINLLFEYSYLPTVVSVTHPQPQQHPRT